MACFFATATVVSSTPTPTPTPKTPAAPHSLSVPHALSAAARPLRLAASSSRSARTSAFVARAGGVDDLPLVGNKAPNFEAEAVFDQEFINVKLSDYIGKKYVILFFYPLDFTFVCPTEITAFSDRYEEFEKLNTEIRGVSIDSVGVPCSSISLRNKPRRVDLYYSSWCIRAVDSRRGNGGSTACEVLLFHHEDMGIPFEIAKIGIRQGMWGCVKSIEPGLRVYQKARAAGEPLSQSALMAHINTKVGDNFVGALESNSDQSDIVEAEEKPAKNHVARFLVLGGAVALACTLDQGLLTKALIFGVARKFVGQRKTL